VPCLWLNLYSVPACRPPYAISCVFACPLLLYPSPQPKTDATFRFQTQVIVPINVSTAATSLLEGQPLAMTPLLRVALTSFLPLSPLSATAPAISSPGT
jgi:hypothetical protein